MGPCDSMSSHHAAVARRQDAGQLFLDHSRSLSEIQAHLADHRTVVLNDAGPSDGPSAGSEAAADRRARSRGSRRHAPSRCTRVHPIRTLGSDRPCTPVQATGSSSAPIDEQDQLAAGDRVAWAEAVPTENHALRGTKRARIGNGGRRLNKLSTSALSVLRNSGSVQTDSFSLAASAASSARSSFRAVSSSCMHSAPAWTVAGCATHINPTALRCTASSFSGRCVAHSRRSAPCAAATRRFNEAPASSAFARTAPVKSNRRSAVHPGSGVRGTAFPTTWLHFVAPRQSHVPPGTERLDQRGPDDVRQVVVDQVERGPFGDTQCLNPLSACRCAGGAETVLRTYYTLQELSIRLLSCPGIHPDDELSGKHVGCLRRRKAPLTVEHRLDSVSTGDHPGDAGERWFASQESRDTAQKIGLVIQTTDQFIAQALERVRRCPNSRPSAGSA